MNQIFDFFDTSEIPSLVLCTPNKDELFSLPLANGIKNTLRYNAQSTLEFSYPQSADGGVTADPAYEYILGKMLILVGGTTYYTITSAPEDCSGSVPIKVVSAISLEAEMLSRRVTGFSGTYAFADLLQRILDLIPTWTIGTIDASLLTLYRTFDSNNRTIYSFLVEDMEKAYGAIFEFDTLNRTVSAIANTIPIVATNSIYLSFDNLIKSTQHKEITEELCTALYCYGGEGLDIHYVNPLGTNVIYNFDYFKTTDWMSQELIDALNVWEVEVAIQQPIYANKLTTLETYQNIQLIQQTDLTDLNGQLASMNDVRAARIEQGLDTVAIDAQIAAQYILIASKNIQIAATQQSIDILESELRKIVHGLFFTTKISYENFLEDTIIMGITLLDMSTNWVDTYNSAYPGLSDASKTLLASSSTTIASLIVTATTKMKTLETLLSVGYSSYPPSSSEIDVLTDDIESEIITLNTFYGVLESIISGTSVTSEIDGIRDILTAYLEIINYSSNMTEEQYLELSSYIYENTYTNSNIIITDSMTPAEIQVQSQDLYNQALVVLTKVSTPRYEFSGEFSNFVAVKGFSSFTNDLELGSVITIQKADNTFIGAVLLEIGITYDNPEDFTMIFSNSFRLDNSSFIYSDFLGTAAQLGSNVGASSVDGTGGVTIISGGGSSTTITGTIGPASSTDNALARWDGTAGTTLQDSLIKVEDDGRMGLGIALPDANAILDLTSTTKAFLPPRMTTTERNAIPSPKAGMEIYNITTSKINYYTTSWQEVGGAGNIVGPVTSTDNGVARWSGTDGKTLEDGFLQVQDNDPPNSKYGGTINLRDMGGQVYNVMAYGAYNDGSHEAETTTAIATAIATLPPSGGTVYFPAGTYLLNAGLTLGNLTGSGYSTRHGITLMGAGTGSSGFFNKVGYWGASVLKCNFGGTLISINGASSCTLRDLCLDGNNQATTLIDSNAAPLLRVDNVLGYKWYSDYAVKIRNTSASYYSAGSMEYVWTNVHMRNPGNTTAKGLDICPNETNFHNISELTFSGCSFSRGSDAAAVGLRLGYCDHTTFVKTFFCRDDATMTGIGIQVAPCTGYAAYPQGVTFIGSPIWRGISVSGTWTAAGNGTYPALIFYPYYCADGQYLPPLDYAGNNTLPNNLVRGVTDNGYNIGVSHLTAENIAVSGTNATVIVQKHLARFTNASGATTIQTINLDDGETGDRPGGTEITIVPIISSGSIALVTGGNITAAYTMVNCRPIKLIYNYIDGWCVVDTGLGGSGISDAPVDGTPYLRQSAGWVTGAGEAWTQATLTPTWVNHSGDNDTGTYKSAGYYKDRNNIVHLKGMVKNGTIGTSIFTLPVGYRPTNKLLFAVNANYAFGSVDIFPTTGQVYAQTGATTAFSLEGITFRAG